MASITRSTWAIPKDSPAGAAATAWCRAKQECGPGRGATPGSAARLLPPRKRVASGCSGWVRPAQVPLLPRSLTTHQCLFAAGCQLASQERLMPEAGPPELPIDGTDGMPAGELHYEGRLAPSMRRNARSQSTARLRRGHFAWPRKPKLFRREACGTRRLSGGNRQSPGRPVSADWGIATQLNVISVEPQTPLTQQRPLT